MNDSDRSLQHQGVLGRKPIKQAFVIAWAIPKWLLFSLPKSEWMKLLAVPVVLAFAGSLITRQFQEETNQNAVLKAYFDKLEELTFERKLLAEKPDDGAIVMARGRTVAALRELDHSRKAQLIAFLQASDLLQIKEDSAPVISFNAQNLSGLDFHGINLSDVDFQESNLREANLTGAELWYANLSWADLREANLTGAELRNANLIGAKLWYANLSRADLSEANLTGAFLSYANLSRAELSYANLTGAIGLIQDQLTLAKLCRTTLPEDITLDPNRDCQELRIDPATGGYLWQ